MPRSDPDHQHHTKNKGNPNGDRKESCVVGLFKSVLRRIDRSCEGRGQQKPRENDKDVRGYSSEIDDRADQNVPSAAGNEVIGMIPDVPESSRFLCLQLAREGQAFMRFMRRK